MNTVVVLEVAAASLVAGVLPIARDAREVSGLRAAGLAAACEVGACASHMLRRSAEGPALIASSLALNVFLYFALALQWQDYREFDEPRASGRLPFGLATAFSVAFAALWAAGSAYVPRVVVTSLFLATLAGAGAWQLARGGLARERSRLIGIGLGGLTTLCMFVRVGVLLGSDSPSADFETTPLERAIGYFPMLLFTLGGGLGFVIMHRERSDARARQLAHTDELSGCLNRRAFERRVRDEVEYARRASKPLALIVADIDHFKRVNDAHGHLGGDATLRHVARLLQQEARSSDAVARYGGEEFCLVLRDASAESATAVAERLRRALRASPAVLEGGETVRVTLSLGVAAYDVAAPEDWEGLFRRADGALYQAKREGRDCVVTA